MLQFASEVKFLWVEIDYKLIFEQQIYRICQSAANQLNALIRLKRFLGFQERKALVNSSALSNFNYCTLVWMFASSKSLTKTENLHKRAHRFMLLSSQVRVLWRLLRARSSLTFSQTTECGFTLKLVRDMIIIHSQMHRTDKYSQHSWVIWPNWLNGWVFVYELSGCRFESWCGHLNFRYGACFEEGVPWHSGELQCRFTLKLVRDIIITYSQIHSTEKYSQNSSIVWPNWLNG